MIKIYQTKFAGIDAPIGERGNCWQAAVASILELPLDEVPDIQLYGHDLIWFDEFREWLEQYGLGAIGLSTGGNITLQGYHLMECKSTTLNNDELHVVVGLNQELAHDPNPNAATLGEVVDYIIFTALDPARERESFQRHLKNITDKRLKTLEDNTMTKRCKHEFETKEGYADDIICHKCQTIWTITDYLDWKATQIMTLPLEIRRLVLKRQAAAFLRGD